MQAYVIFNHHCGYMETFFKLRYNQTHFGLFAARVMTRRRLTYNYS
jgi:hypothetical protein